MKRLHATIALAFLGAAGLLLTARASAQHAPRDGVLDRSGRRDGHAIVRVTVTSRAHLDEILALGAEPLSCHVGPGVQEFCVSPAALAQLRAMGVAMVVLHPDAQALIDAERARMFGLGRAAPDEGGIAGPPQAWFAEYKTFAQINAYLDDLAVLRPDLASVIDVGTSIEGRTLRAIRITSAVGGQDKPAVIFNGCQHAREWIATMVPTFIADTLVREYGVNPRITELLDRVEFYIVPVVNPDGFEFTYAPPPVGDRMWRKNRRDSGDGNFGVDLNRNWSVDWGGPNSTSTDPGSEIYIGTGPFSEPESAAMRDFMLARQNLVAHIDFHSYGQLILQTWGHTNAENPDYDIISRAGTAANDGIASVHNSFYENGWGGSLLYLVSGVMRDWCYGERGMLSHTIELRDRGSNGFILPPEQILPTCQEALEGALTLTERSIAGAEFFFPRGLPQAIVADSPTTVLVDIQPTPNALLQSASATVKWRVGSSARFASTPLVPVSGARYQATLPALACGQRLEFYFEILSAAGLPLRSPEGAPSSAIHLAVAARNLLVYDFETAAGWTTSSAGGTGGPWQRGVPVNDANWPYDPRHDADGTGAGACYLTGNTLGASDLDNGSVLLTSPGINVGALLSPGEQPSIAYAWYLRTVSPVGGDFVRLDLSVTGTSGPFTTVSTNIASGTTWNRARVGAPSWSNATSLRFVAADGNPQSIVEAAIDDVRIMGDCGTTACPSDANRDGAVNSDDLTEVILTWGTCGPPGPPCRTDVAPLGGDGQVNADDLVAVVLGWGPCL